ncbi:MAG: hypothetical protein IJW55_06995, partial [Clostridia bacterium]|nr:hypothetical protein [Clostridia bacterium]
MRLLNSTANEKSLAVETVDKTNEFRQFAESFGRAFSKARAVEGAEPSSRSAEREISLSALS